MDKKIIELEEEALGKIIAGLGYTMGEVKKKPYQKKKLFGKWYGLFLLIKYCDSKIIGLV